MVREIVLEEKWTQSEPWHQAEARNPATVRLSLEWFHSIIAFGYQASFLVLLAVVGVVG